MLAESFESEKKRESTNDGAELTTMEDDEDDEDEEINSIYYRLSDPT